MNLRIEESVRLADREARSQTFKFLVRRAKVSFSECDSMTLVQGTVEIVERAWKECAQSIAYLVVRVCVRL